MNEYTQPRSAITQLLIEWRSGSADALDRLIPLVVDELRRIATLQMDSEAADHTLQPTALVNELFLRLVDRRTVTWQNRAHFFGSAARAMRRILIDHARIKKAGKRGADAIHVPLESEEASRGALSTVELIALDEALGRLAEMDEKQARIVEMRFFGGLTIPEISEVLETSPSTVSRAWASAKAWLYGEMAVGRRLEA